MLLCIHVCYYRSRKDLYKNITPDYYGYRDEIWNTDTSATAQDTTSAASDVALGHAEHNILQVKEKEMESYWRSQAEEAYATKKRALLIQMALGGAGEGVAGEESSSEEEEEVC